ncbi:MAG: pyruvate,water dikinase [Verrucomicrobiales bacterium]|jgi:pyruvate,water dikinase
MKTTSEPATPSETEPDLPIDRVLWLETLTIDDIAIVGGKTASLGEMIRNLKEKDIKIPTGFAITADAYREFIEFNKLQPLIRSELERKESGVAMIGETERRIRTAIVNGTFPPALHSSITEAYSELCQRSGLDGEVDVAVRSSATAEDLPGASFAGQHESFLAVHGSEDLLHSVLRCFASLFTERAIAYRERKGFDHMSIALSVCVQRMVRSDKAAAGVMFTLDTENGNPNTIVINAAYGLGETVVKGMVTPDEYRVFKPTLQAGFDSIVEKRIGSKESKMVYGDRFGARVQTVNTPLHLRGKFVLDDEQILELARWASVIEKHYKKPMDIEWAVDGITGECFIVQARPETVQSEIIAPGFKISRLKEANPKLILEGNAVGNTIAAGTVCILRRVTEGDKLKDGQILVAASTDPDWVPLMKRAAGIVTDQGGRTSHAAIVSRELGIPAVIGTGTATHVLFKDQEITISCAEGETGKVYRRILPYEDTEIDLADLPKTQTKVMLNIASPDAADRWWRLPCDGIGLARMEFIINNVIRIHPMALARFDSIDDDAIRAKVARMTANYPEPSDYFIDQLSMSIGHIAASRYPNPVIVRMSDFKTNEYAKLIGGEQFEEKEENPMIGFRGASRYYSDDYRPGFELECQAIRRARTKLGLDNIIVMIPFCRTLDEADQVLEIMESQGLKRGEEGLEVYVMAEIPSNIILATQFAERFDGFSIGSNDLTQLTLGIDRDSAKLSAIFDEKNAAVTESIRCLIRDAHAAGRKVGICGQAASDPDFAEFLIREGIDSISIVPDSLIEVVNRVSAIEAQLSQ